VSATTPPYHAILVYDISRWGRFKIRTNRRITSSCPGVSVIVVETDYHDRVPGYESWWDVAVAEVSESKLRPTSPCRLRKSDGP
jgi:hypothetical protein